MNRITRMLTMAGLGLVTGVTFGAGPAMASPSATDQGAARSQSSVGPWWDDDDYRVVGYFRSWDDCEDRGEYGEDRGWWDDPECYRVPGGFNFGFRRYVLVVEDDNWGHGWSGNWGNGFHQQWWGPGKFNFHGKFHIKGNKFHNGGFGPNNIHNGNPFD